MPTYNEAEGLASTVASLLTEVPSVDLLIIDDNSPDGTGQLAETLRSDRVQVLHREQKQGLGRAYLAGYDWAIARDYQRIVQMDADLSHRPADLVKMLQAEGDLIIGSRWVSGGEVLNWPGYRKAISRLGNIYASLTTGLGVNDLTAGFRIYSADLLRRMDLSGVRAHGYGFQVEMTLRASNTGATISEVPITFVERASGKSKMTLGIIFEAFWLCTLWGLKRSRR